MLYCCIPSTVITLPKYQQAKTVEINTIVCVLYCISFRNDRTNCLHAKIQNLSARLVWHECSILLSISCMVMYGNFTCSLNFRTVCVIPWRVNLHGYTYVAALIDNVAVMFVSHIVTTLLNSNLQSLNANNQNYQSVKTRKHQFGIFGTPLWIITTHQGRSQYAAL